MINQIYDSQPTSVEAFESLIKQHEPAIRECLTREGVAASELETIADLREQSIRLNYRQLESGLSDPVDCLAESGISW